MNMAQKKFVCSVCGYVHNGDKAPEVCPVCKQSGVFTETKDKKKGIDTNSNVYTIIYAAIIVIVVAVLLALVSQVLKPRQDKNKLLDTQKQILVALKQDFSKANPAELYKSLVVDTLTYGEKQVYVANIKGETVYVLKLHGAGLWGGIGGYLALKEDKNTIYGINFNHESETPGLGAEIVTEKFRNQFIGKSIRNKNGEVVSVAVLKSGKSPAMEQEKVDALSGATITCDGVSTMLATNLAEYAAFLNTSQTPNSTNQCESTTCEQTTCEETTCDKTACKKNTCKKATCDKTACEQTTCEKATCDKTACEAHNNVSEANEENVSEANIISED